MKIEEYNIETIPKGLSCVEKVELLTKDVNEELMLFCPGWSDGQIQKLVQTCREHGLHIHEYAQSI